MKTIPASPEYRIAEKLHPLAEALVKYQESSGSKPNDKLEAIYHRALKLIEMGNLPAALDGLLEVLRKDRKYAGGEARLVFVGLLELLGDSHPLTKEYRTELASILF
ncbi:MAG: tetratricopeptide repeat protein [Chitinivibrionales bacterium]|nr:tetratricopeptide repeat protein [Chitinivibrionales bacterium]